MTNDRVALVTGSTGGIGYAIAAALAKNGLSVVVSGRAAAEAAEAAKAIADASGGRVSSVELDVTAPASVAAAVSEISERLGGIHVLVNNAGINIDGGQRPSELDFALLGRTLDTNVTGAWRMANAVLPAMKRAGYGRIVNVSSALGAITEGVDVAWPAYRVSKLALNLVTRMLAKELEGTPILVNSGCPGWVRTRLGGPGAPRSPEEGADTLVWLATLPDDGPRGGFFRDRKPAAW